MDVEWIDKELAEKVYSGICPDCGGKLWEGPHGGMAVNVMCGECKHKFNDCFSIGVHRIMSEIFSHKAIDMTLIDWFATFAPEIPDDKMRYQLQLDRNKVTEGKLKGNYGIKARSEIEIRADYKYMWAHAMMSAREHMR